MERKSVIVKRMKVLLKNDSVIPPGLIDALTHDINEVLKSYFEYDHNLLKIQIKNNEASKNALIIYTDITRAKCFNAI
ncbi:MAG: cell division topological specificity factor MinE [Christensenellaceae bacterium]|jgi:septum formation topological specificity factor MinE|nr:cell division topological specificity factor MinE [Christensenellaceae bacterium]